MGLLSVPKKYNPPGNGKRDMEYPIFATKQEMGLLKMRGGSGKMTKHGIRSFGLGDKGNSVGSAGGSNYSGDGMGGQVNLDGVGGKTGNVLRNIAGKWTIVDKATGAARDSEGRAISSPVSRPQVQYTPAAAPVQTVATPIKLPSIPASTLAAQYGMYKNPTANMPATTTAPASYPNSMPGNVNQSLNYGPGTSSPTVNAVSPLGMGGTRGSWSTPASPSSNSMPGNSDPGMNYGPGTTPSTLQGMGGARGSWATPSRPPNNTPSTPTSNGPQTRGQMPNYGAGPAVDPGMSNNASYFGDVSDFQGSTPPRPAVTSMLAEAQRRAASNRLQEQYSQYRSPPGSPMAPGGLDRYADMTTGGKFGAGSTQLGMTPEATPDRAFNVGVMDAPRLSADPTNGISAYPGAGVPGVPFVKDQSRIAQGLKEYDTYDRIAPTIKDQSRIPAAPDYTRRFAPPPSEVSADLYSRVDQLIGAMNRPRESEVGVPASMGPTFGPETPAGPEGWQQGDVSIDPTSSTPLDYAKEIAMNTPIARAATGIMNVLDRISGGPAYRDDVSLGTDESGRRTDRAPSGGGFSTSPGSFGPGGQDRRGGNVPGPQSQKPMPQADADFVKTLPESEQRRLTHLYHTDRKKFAEELAKLKATPSTGGGGTAPGTPGPFQWYYPQYQSTWANLPTGLGGTYGRA